MRTLLKQALDALVSSFHLVALDVNTIVIYRDTSSASRKRVNEAKARLTAHVTAIAALESELAKPEPEPVAWVHVSDTKMPWDKTLPYKFAFVKEESWTFAVPLYAVPLRSPTDAELVELARDSKNCEGNSMLPVAFAREVEALVTGTRNCSRHPDAPHGPDGAGCKCHNWALGEAS